MHPFRKAVEDRDEVAIQALLADTVVFTSPVAFKPYVGKPITAALLRGVLRIFEDFHYVREIAGSDGRDHALVFETGISGAPGVRITGCDFLHFDERRSDRRLHGHGAAAVGGDGAIRSDGRPVRSDPAGGVGAGREVRHRVAHCQPADCEAGTNGGAAVLRYGSARLHGGRRG